MNISIFGMGYVGAISLACLARDGHRVTGVDVDSYKLDMIGAGKSPIIEEDIQQLMAEVVASGNVAVTDDVAAALRASDISFICVGTPSAANGSQDQRALLSVARQLGEALKHKNERHIVVFRSTVVPGTVEDLLAPMIEQASGKRRDLDFDVCFQPEFLREGTSIKDYDNPPFTIVGVTAEHPRKKLHKVFGHLPCDFHVTSIRTAEMIKYCCNNFHTVKITYANEIARLCEALKVNPFEVMDLVCQDRQLNISSAYLRPGYAFGGSCLPKDLRATLYMAKQRDLNLPMLASLMRSNQEHIDHAFEKVMSMGERRVGMIGLAFKSGTDDLRESPLVTLAERLLGKGMDIVIYDPEVSLSRLLGANKRYIEEHIPHIGELLRPSLQNVVAHGPVLVLGSGDKEVQAELKALLQPHHRLIDLAPMKDITDLPCVYEGLCW